MNITDDDYKRILFLTRTNISFTRIKRLAKYFTKFNELTERINRLNYPDLDFDWTLFDFEYKHEKTIYSENIKIISEEDIFKGTYTHKCRNSRNYLIQIIGTHGYCRRCDTQFFPELWWNHPLKDDLSYKEIKYGSNVPYIKFNTDKKYIKNLTSIGVDERILNKIFSTVTSLNEVDKILNTRLYDKNNPPMPGKIHAKLIFLNNVWETRPVLSLGILPDAKYFFHKCNNKSEKILFREKLLYSWCPSCFSKFIPEQDKDALKNYKNYFTVKTYINGYHETYINNSNEVEDSSEESFYLSVLGLDKNPTIEEINSTFRKLSKLYHPDLGGENMMFQEIVKAKKWLREFYEGK